MGWAYGMNEDKKYVHDFSGEMRRTETSWRT